jgi:serine/threonine protein kinase
MLRVLDQIDGGPSVHDFFTKAKVTVAEYLMFNRSLVNLIPGIVALNERKVLHLDVKDKNMVVDKRTGLTRLIDWGLSVKETDIIGSDDGAGEKEPFYFIMQNTPPGLMLTCSITMNALEEIQIPTTFLRRNIIAALAVYLLSNKHALDIRNNTNPDYPPNHVSFISASVGASFMYLGGAEQQVLMEAQAHVTALAPSIRQENQRSALTSMPGYVAGVLYLHLHAILSDYLLFLNNDTYYALAFCRPGYVRDVFMHNCDLHGMLTSYFRVYERGTFRTNLSVINDICTTVSALLYKYIISPQYAATPIDTEELQRDITALNSYITSTPVPVLSATPPALSPQVEARKQRDLIQQQQLLASLSTEPLFW